MHENLPYIFDYVWSNTLSGWSSPTTTPWRTLYKPQLLLVWPDLTECQCFGWFWRSSEFFLRNWLLLWKILYPIGHIFICPNVIYLVALISLLNFKDQRNLLKNWNTILRKKFSLKQTVANLINMFWSFWQLYSCTLVYFKGSITQRWKWDVFALG